uniref:F-box domain-containing protein n=1 Tax=Leersia perrieri TaxID=77586 RepID=A0A0D9W7X1_9ORYZ
MKCEVYTLGSQYGDCWRPAAGGVPFRFCRAVNAVLANAEVNKQPPVIANGCFHWLVHPSYLAIRRKAAVVSFSMQDETLIWIRTPSFMRQNSVVHLVEIYGHLCMVCDRRHSLDANGAHALEIWNVVDYSSGVWALLHHISLPGHTPRSLLEAPVVKVLGSIGDAISAKKIIIATSELTVHMYDLMTENLETVLSIKDTDICYDQNKPSALRISLVKESLSPVHRTNEEMILSSPLAKAVKEILLRLPSRSVMKFKLVCKQWCMLIEKDWLISSYFEYWNIDRRPKIMLVSKGNGLSWLHFYSLPEIVSRSTQMARHKGVSSCNRLMISNVWRQSDRACAVGNGSFGLGFNPLTQEHVVVEIYYQRKDFRTREYCLECEIWVCSTNYSFPCSHNIPLPVNDMPPAYLAGFLYWKSEPRLGPSYEWSIVAFDIDRKMFDLIHCPSCLPKWSSESPCYAFVAELDGLLCVVYADPVTDMLEIWKLGHGQWDKAYTLCLKKFPGYSLGTNVVIPLAQYMRDGRILLSTGRKIAYYDPTKHNIEDVYSVDEILNLSSKMQTHPYLTASAGKDLVCSNGLQCMEEQKGMNTAVIPLVPMLNEDSLVRYPQKPKMRNLIKSLRFLPFY